MGFEMADDNKKKRKHNEPIVLDEYKLKELLKLSRVLNTEQIADFFGFSKQTLYNIFERQPEARIAYKKGKSQAIASIAGNLISLAQSGHVAAMMFYLKTQAGWRETTHIDHSNSDGTMVAPTRIELVSPKDGEVLEDEE